MRPLPASQRGLSGRLRRKYQTNNALTPPSSTTQRQPSTPNGAAGTSRYDRNATTGTAEKPIVWQIANARPRRCFGASSDM